MATIPLLILQNNDCVGPSILTPGLASFPILEKCLFGLTCSFPNLSLKLIAAPLLEGLIVITFCLQLSSVSFLDRFTVGVLFTEIQFQPPRA